MPVESVATASSARRVVVGVTPMSIEDVCALAFGEKSIELSSDPAWRSRLNASRANLRARFDHGDSVYGVTTGFGDSCTRDVPPDLALEMPHNLVRYHGCGLGREFDEPQSAAILAARVASLARACSGVRMELVDRLCTLLNERLLPAIPEEGSVGASGDLTPLSYVAAVVIGERDVIHHGERLTAAEALRAAGLSPLTLEPKEGLAIMNGTAVMTALGCLAFERAQRLVELSCRITALNVLALRGNPGHFHERLFELKPHPGQMRAAALIRAGLGAIGSERDGRERIQDPYSLRCAPHVIGVLADALSWMRTWIETELNSANDNPLIDPEQDLVLHGGHFYGGHIAFAMDGLKTAVASVADLLDRQMALLVDPARNRGLPPNLSGAPAASARAHHGFKAVQIGTSAWTAEALKLTLPATSFSRSTECHNQDKVSMGTIAARDAMRVIELTEQVAAATVIAAAQGVHLRGERGELSAPELSSSTTALLKLVREDFTPVIEDRALDGTLRAVLTRMRARPGFALDCRDSSTATSVGGRLP